MLYIGGNIIRQYRKFSELNLNNAFLFAAAMEDEEICRIVLQIILGKQISAVDVKVERAILYNSDYRCIRLDVFANDGYMSYDVEMQNQNENNLPKRTRYQQAVMDMASLKPGQTFNDLKPSLIIFICTFDPFGDGLYRYTYETMCRETGKSLGDEVQKIFLCTKGNIAEGISKELVDFLGYVENSTENFVENHNDAMLKNLHDKIDKLKKNRNLEEKYMTLEEYLQSEIRAGIKEGIEEELKVRSKEFEEEVKARVEEKFKVRSEKIEEELKVRSKELEEELKVRSEKIEEEVKARVEETTQKERGEFIKLVTHMVADGRAGDLQRLSDEPKFLEEMFNLYNI